MVGYERHTHGAGGEPARHPPRDGRALEGAARGRGEAVWKWWGVEYIDVRLRGVSFRNIFEEVCIFGVLMLMLVFGWIK